MIPPPAAKGVGLGEGVAVAQLESVGEGVGEAQGVGEKDTLAEGHAIARIVWAPASWTNMFAEEVRSSPSDIGLLNVAVEPTPLEEGGAQEPLPARVPTVHKKPPPENVPSLGLPGGHAAVHVQLTQEEAPAALKVPKGQGVQVALVEVGAEEDHVPAGQSAHGAVELNEAPEGQGGHTVIKSRSGAVSPSPSATVASSVHTGAPRRKGGVLFNTKSPPLSDTKEQFGGDTGSRLTKKSSPAGTTGGSESFAMDSGVRRMAPGSVAPLILTNTAPVVSAGAASTTAVEYERGATGLRGRVTAGTPYTIKKSAASAGPLTAASSTSVPFESEPSAASRTPFKEP
jgi:hypothetical protein